MNTMSIANLVQSVRNLVTPEMISKAKVDGLYKDPNTGLIVQVFRSRLYDDKSMAEWKLDQVRSEYCEWIGWGEISGEVIPVGREFQAQRVQYSVRKYEPVRVWRNESWPMQLLGHFSVLCVFYNFNILIYTFF